MNFIKVSAINSGIDSARNNYIKNSEDNYLSQLMTASEKIISDREKRPLVLLSGPSGSGKTTSAMKIAGYIRSRGYNVHTLSMDNYFLPNDMGELPVDENGNIDLESPYRLDIPLFSDHLKKLFRCEDIEIPIFDFASQLRKGSVPMRRNDNEIIIIEGIHALNPEVTGVTDDFTTCVYVSVRTRITGYDGSVLHPRNIRLMRRLCRDSLFRGRAYRDIFEMFESVSRGEELYIMPYKTRAAFDIDTFLAYEVPVYAGFLGEKLRAQEKELEDHPNYADIVRFIGEIHSLRSDMVPEDSLIREFIGGSSYSY